MTIHSLEIQLLGTGIVTLFSSGLLVLLGVMCGIPFLSVAFFKDNLLGGTGAFAFLVLTIFALRTLAYSLKLRRFFGVLSLFCSFFRVLSLILLRFFGGTFLNLFGVLSDTTFFGSRILLICFLTFYQVLWFPTRYFLEDLSSPLRFFGARISNLGVHSSWMAMAVAILVLF